MRKDTHKLLVSYLDSLSPIIYIHHSDFPAIDDELRSITEEYHVKFAEFNNALGAVDFNTKRSLHKCELPEFLESVFDMNDDDEPCELFIILKDIHDAIHDPKIIALIRRIAESSNFPAKIIIIDTKIDIPLELESFITLIDVPLPDDEEIRECIETFTANTNLRLDKTSVDELIFALKGLSSFQINQVLSVAYQKGGTLDASDRKYILEEKEQMIKKSGILEMINFEESIDELEKAFAGIGGSNGDVTATANDISKLPAEFLRKGRFDELFSVDLPNENERKKILEVHLRKRDNGRLNPSIDLDKLSRETENFSGSDLEGIVKEAVETAFIEGKDAITTDLLMQIRRETKSIYDI